MKLFLCLLGIGGMPLAGSAAADTPTPSVVETAAAVNAERETVVLLHGLGRTGFSMLPLACTLEREGYRVINLTYPSRSQSLETLATEWLPARLREHGIARASRLHLVTHSMGGILVRLWLREQGIPENLGTVVMLAPPNSGSELSDRLQAFPPFRWVTGVNGRRLTTATDALPRALGPWPAPERALGVIAGDRTINPLMAAWLPAPNDGKVTVASTHLAGEHAHVTLPYSHTWLAWRRGTATQVKAFLRSGRFLATAA